MIWLLAWLNLAYGHTVNYSHGSFAEAKDSRNFIKFEMASTKVGLFTSRFNGFARKFSVNYELEGDAIKTARITIPIDQLDTDADSRNEALRQDSLNYRRFPDITVLVADPIPIDGQERNIPAIINLRGNTKPILLQVKAARKDRKLVAEISGTISLNELAIPAPPILISRVHDEVGLKAKLEAAE